MELVKEGEEILEKVSHLTFEARHQIEQDDVLNFHIKRISSSIKELKNDSISKKGRQLLSLDMAVSIRYVNKWLDEF